MAIPFVENYNGDGSNRIFTVISTILSESHVRVDFYYEDVLGAGFTDHQIPSNEWDVINNSIVFTEAPEAGLVVKISVSSDGEGLDIPPSDVTNVAQNLPKIISVYENEVNINQAVANEVNINQAVANEVNINQAVANEDNINSVSNNMTAILNCEGDAEQAKLDKWHAIAAKMTSYSYATEPVDVPVKIYTSNGNGTFTTTATIEFSSYHWSFKASSGLIDDEVLSPLKAYSNVKTQALHDAQAMAIANLATASGQIENLNTPVFSSIPKSPLVGHLEFNTITPSSNISIFELDTVNNLFKLKQVSNYNFQSVISIKSNVSASRIVTFRLVDNATDLILKESSMTVVIASGTTETFPINTLLDVIIAPVDVRVDVTCSDTGFELRSFNSIVSSGVGVGSESVEAIDESLGNLVSGSII